MNLARHSLVLIVRIYRAVVSPVLSAVVAPMGLGCRFTPTCSQYALEAVQRHGAVRGGALTVKRLCRCQPWGGCGHDPVPGDGSPGADDPTPIGSGRVSVDGAPLHS